MLARKQQRGNNNPPPAPVVTPTTQPGAYNVRSRRSGNIYLATVGSDGSVSCGCPAHGRCYHTPHVERAHALATLSDGDRVLVSEVRGPAWHTAIGANATKVFTVEVPTGFSHVFVVRVERARKARAA